MKQEKNSLKDKISKFKELWKNPKYNAIIKICMYMLFILILVLIVRLGSNADKASNINTNIHNLNYNNMSSYEYEIIIKNNKENINIKGIKFNECNDFEIVGEMEKYSIIDNKLYKTLNEEYVESLLDINLISLLPDNISKYIINENLKSEIEYDDGQIKKEYTILNFNLLNSTDKQTLITTYEKSNLINKIEINASEMMKDNGFTDYNIEINYNNINKIKNYKSR